VYYANRERSHMSRSASTLSPSPYVFSIENKVPSPRPDTEGFAVELLRGAFAKLLALPLAGHLHIRKRIRAMAGNKAIRFFICTLLNNTQGVMAV